MKKLFTAFALVTAVILSSMPVMAAEYTENGTANCVVTAEISSSYQVSVPATLSLSYNESASKFEGTYQVGAKGNIAGDKKVVVGPSSDTMTMTGRTTSTVAQASVTQAVKEFVLAGPTAGQTVIGSSDYANVNGTVSVALDKADLYEGTIVFAFSLQDK